MHFASPYYLWLLTALVPMAGYYVWRTLQGGAAIQISSVDGVVRAPKTIRYYLRHLPFVLRAAAFALLVVALARPQDVERLSHTNTEGIDIMLAIDVSGSMLARDFRPDRITAAKEVAGSFIADRYGDRIGLVAFAGEAFTQSPLTTDQGTLQTLLSRIRSGLIEDGTAIGNGLATAINRLRESEAKSKVIILLTDGVNNHGEIAPLTAAEIAKRGVEGCVISGPLALDGAISMESVKHKSIQDPGAGQADILLVPFIEIGNVLYKACTYIAGKTMASTICGASCPVVITSRADTPDSKYYSILMAVLRCIKGC